MALQTANQYNLVPSVNPLVDAISSALKDRKEEMKAAEDAKQARLAQELQTVGAQMKRLREIGDDTTQRTQIARLAHAAINRGEDAKPYQDALNIWDKDERDMFLTQMFTRADAHVKNAQRWEPVKDEAGNIIGQRNTLTGEVKETPQDGKPGESNKLQFGAQEVFKDAAGNLFFGTTRRNPASGDVEPVLTPVGHGDPIKGQLKKINTTGQTADEKIRDAVEQTRQISEIEIEATGEKKREELTVEGEMAPTVEAKKETAKTRAKTKEERISLAIDAGKEAAGALVSVKRALDILDEVETGGLNAALLRAKQIFGTESADEAELSNTMGKAVLSQLRDTFGAAFTQDEGKRLERIEANYGKSTEGNKRILRQLMQMLENKVEEGLIAADEAGDNFAKRAIERARQFELGGPDKKESVKWDELQ